MDKNERPDRPTTGRRAPLIGSLSDCSAWLASQGIEYTPREILEDAAEGLLLLHVPVHEDGFIPVCVEKPTPDDIRAQFEALGKDPEKTRTHSVGERPAIKGELIPVRPEECLQFIAAGETSVLGPGFTLGDVMMAVPAHSEFAKAIFVQGIDGFKVKRKDMEDYRSRRFNAVKRVAWLEAALMDVEAQNSSSPEAVYSAEQAEAAATALQGYWFKFDTWKLAEGLKLLVGIDPRYSDSVEITDDGKVHLRAAPQCFRLGFPPKREFQEGKPFVVTTGQTNCRPEVDRLLLLRDIWRANPELASLPAAPPQKFIAFAESKGLAPYWLEAARAKGIVPSDPDRAPDKPAAPPTGAQEAEEVEKPQQRQQEPLTPRTDYSLLATRQQLIDAFGAFTGMDLSWFNNLKDSPELKRARKLKGTSGKRPTEPWFCPYQVMKWLVSPKFKKKNGNKRMTEATGWRRLKGCFPSVYAVHELEDPAGD